jgi:hypothetical protein
MYTKFEIFYQSAFNLFYNHGVEIQIIFKYLVLNCAIIMMIMVLLSCKMFKSNKNLES